MKKIKVNIGENALEIDEALVMLYENTVLASFSGMAEIVLGAVYGIEPLSVLFASRDIKELEEVVTEAAIEELKCGYGVNYNEG